MNSEVRHLRDIMDERDRRYQQRFESDGVARENALDSINRRLDLLNELRQGVATDVELRALEKQVNELSKRMSEREGRGAGLTAGWAVLVGALLLAVAIITVVRG